jgi:hypothetical protein
MGRCRRRDGLYTVVNGSGGMLSSHRPSPLRPRPSAIGHRPPSPSSSQRHSRMECSFSARQATTQPRTKRPWYCAGKDPNRLEVLERVAWHMIEQIELLVILIHANAKVLSTRPTAIKRSSSGASSELLVTSAIAPSSAKGCRPGPARRQSAVRPYDGMGKQNCTITHWGQTWTSTVSERSGRRC